MCGCLCVSVCVGVDWERPGAQDKGEDPEVWLDQEHSEDLNFQITLGLYSPPA